MAGNNFISYERFFNLPVNIELHGYTPEESEITKGKVETNVDIQAMATPEPHGLLATGHAASHLNAPQPFVQNDFVGFRHDHLVIMDAQQKAGAPIGQVIVELLDSGELDSMLGARKSQIRASLAFEAQMYNKVLNELNSDQRYIFARVRGEVKG